MLPRSMPRACWAAAALLAGCGGGGDLVYRPGPPLVLVDQSTSATGGGDGPAAGYAGTVDGPAFTITRAASVEICTDGTWRQQAARPVALTLKLTAPEPVQGGATTTTSAAADATHAGSIPFGQCNLYALPDAGVYRLQALLQLSTDCGCTDALGTYTLNVHWTVKAQYQGI